MRERVVLVANHLLAAEPQAMTRLRPHAGRVIRLAVALPGRAQEWAGLTLAVTPAGLLEDAGPQPAAQGLDVIADAGQPLQAVLALVGGRRPPLRIEGDAAFAADVAGLIDHVRWEAEDDLARLIGDAPAHQVMQVMRSLRRGLQPLLDRLTRAAGAEGVHGERAAGGGAQ